MTATRKRSGDEGGVFGGRMGSVWERLSSGFWFIPALLVLCGVILYFVAQYLDQLMQTNRASLPIVFSGGPTTARSVLSTIAGSSIAVVATMFSLTVVASSSPPPTTRPGSCGISRRIAEYRWC